jgi:ribonuclease BN (tRNA processing enzyme)
MKITFLGTGGARFATITQVRATGGWILEMDGEMIHVDPGPGALVRARQYGVNLQKLTGIVISHAHPDHTTDAPFALEAMTHGAMKKKGAVIGSEYVFRGDGDKFIPVFSKYHLDSLERHVIMEPGKKTFLGKVEIEAVGAKHPEPRALGFVFSGEGRKVGYTGDGEYYEGQEKHFRDCDYLLINCHRPKESPLKGYMDSEGARKLVEGAKPKEAILTHFGMKMMRGVAVKEARWIEQETGIRTIAARDGMTLDGEPAGSSNQKSGIGRFLSK